MFKRPLIPVALSYLGGLLLANSVEASLLALFLVTFALALAALFLARLRAVLLLAVVFFAGWTNLASRTAILSPHDLRPLLGDKSRLVQLRVTLAETPSRRVFVQDDTKLGDVFDRSEHAIWWRTRHARLQTLVKENGEDFLSERDYGEFRRMGHFIRHLPDILSLVADTLRPHNFNDLDKYWFD